MTRSADDGRVRQAKGSVQEAIGKLIGDVAVERHGARESDAGAREANAADAHADGKPAGKVSPNPKAKSGAKSGSGSKGAGPKGGTR